MRMLVRFILFGCAVFCTAVFAKSYEYKINEKFAYAAISKVQIFGR